MRQSTVLITITISINLVSSEADYLKRVGLINIKVSKEFKHINYETGK